MGRSQQRLALRRSSILSVYGSIWLIADYRAAVLRPVLSMDGHLKKRAGLRFRVDVPPANIDRIESERPDMPSMALTVLSESDQWLVFRAPVTAEERYLASMSEQQSQKIEVGLSLDKGALMSVLQDPELRQLTLEFREPSSTFRAAAKVLSQADLKIEKLILEDANFEPGAEVGKPLLTAKGTADFWRALPQLTSLELVGHRWLASLEHPGLRSLQVTGFGFGEAPSLAAKVDCPQLEELSWSFTRDQHGVALDPGALDGLWAATGLPGLRHLDLGEVELVAPLLEEATFLDGKLLSQLERLVLPKAHVEREHLESALPKLAGLKTIGVDDEALLGLDPRLILLEAGSGEAAIASAGSAGGKTHFVLGFDADESEVRRELASVTGSLEKLEIYAALPAELTGEIGALARQYPGLKSIHIENQTTDGWEAPAVEAFASAMGEQPYVTHLNLAHNQMTGAGEALAALLANMPSVEAVDLDSTDLSAEDLEVLVPALGECPRLRHLSVMGSADGDKAGILWSEFSSQSLESLALPSMQLSESVGALFAARMGERLPACRKLDHGRTVYGAAALKSMAGGFDGAGCLEDLEFGLEVSDASYDGLAELLRKTSLRRLEFFEVVPSGLHPVAAARLDGLSVLGNAASLQELVLGHVARGDHPGVMASLLQGLGSIESLRHIQGLRCKLDKASLDEVKAHLASTKLRSFEILQPEILPYLFEANLIEHYVVNMSYLAEERLAQIGELCQSNESLRSLRLSGGEVDAKSMKSIKSLLASVPHLERLELDMISDSGRVLTLLRAVKKRPGFQLVISDRSPLAQREMLDLAAKIKGPELSFGSM